LNYRNEYLDIEEFNTDNFAKRLGDFINSTFELEDLKVLIDKYILSRIDIFVHQAKYFVFEDNYVETSWKNMISLHYINTTYKIKGVVARIHFFTRRSIDSKYYLGYITIRPINEFCMMLSYIVPNWNVLAIEGSKCFYVMTYESEVHLNNKTLEMITFPFFVQDGIVASCAHANILMITEYLNKVLGYKKIKLSEIENDYSYERTKSFPAIGLEVPQIAEIFSNSRIPIKVYYYQDINVINHYDDIIRTYIESGIPVILGVKEHVVLIIGHSLDQKGKYEYIIYDDSGALVSEVCEGKKRCFVSIVSWEKIKGLLSDFDFILAPEYDKVYMNYLHISRFFEEQVSKGKLKEMVLNYIGRIGYKKRFLLVDNSYMKKWLADNIVKLKTKEYIREYKDFLSAPLPHYIWYCEVILTKNLRFVFLANPTYHFNTNNNIFYNTYPFFVNSQLGLLKKTKRKSLNCFNALVNIANSEFKLEYRQNHDDF
jgi:hypothetical protein